MSHKALMLAYGEGRQQVEKRHVTLAASDTVAPQRAAWPWFAGAAGLALAFSGDYLATFVDVPDVPAALVFLVLVACLNARGNQMYCEVHPTAQ